MKKYIIALILGFGIVLQGQAVYAQMEDTTADSSINTQTVDKKILANEELMKNILLNPELMKTITPEQLEEYIAKGADVNAKDERGYTPLIYAAKNNKNPEIIETLLKNGADIEAKDKIGSTPLMFATIMNPEVVETLLKYEADVNAKNEDGWTPLMFAIKYKQSPEIIETLLKNGADSTATSNPYLNPFMVATLYNPNSEIIEILKKYTINIVKVYDCPKGTHHKVCGIIENKTSSKLSAKVDIYYYDKDEIKIGETFAYVTIDPYGKAKFETFEFSDSFDHYKLEYQ